MGAFKGSSKLKIYLGSNKVKKAYLGTKQIYSSGSTVTYVISATESYTIEYDEGADVLTFIPSLDGYTFLGWSETDGGDALTSLVMGDEPVTLYALWIANSIVVTDCTITTHNYYSIAYSDRTIDDNYCSYVADTIHKIGNGGSANTGNVVAYTLTSEAAAKYENAVVIINGYTRSGYGTAIVYFNNEILAQDEDTWEKTVTVPTSTLTSYLRAYYDNDSEYSGYASIAGALIKSITLTDPIV